MALQKEKTVEFWNDFYRQEEGSSLETAKTINKEWILHPSHHVLECLWQALPKKLDSTSNYKIFEIGCGTSTLARDFWCYCRDIHGMKHMSMFATDVSPICIRQNRQRDADLILKSQNDDSDGSLQYEVLNIVELSEKSTNNSCNIQPKSFDMILDKGCMDTFLFRSRQRGNHKETLAHTVLTNIHTLLVTRGVYTIISPRSKFQIIRKYPGFQSVIRHVLAGSTNKDASPNENNQRAELMENNASKYKQDGTLKNDNLYLYVCQKGDGSISENSICQTPVDSETCPKCGISFQDFRKGEQLHHRGVKFWTRHFRGHCKHCKGISDESNNE